MEIRASAVPVLAPQAAGARAFSAALSGPDVLTLLASGWAPVSVLVAAASTSRDPALRSSDAAVVTSGRNADIPGYSDVRMRAMRAARASLEAQARELGADGVLMQHGFESRTIGTRRVVEVLAVATAVVATGGQPGMRARPVVFTSA